jgi:outer membrane protein assembly factor BamC
MRVLCGVLSGVLLLGGCSSFGDWVEGKDKIKYKSSATLPPLEVPPDLTSPTRDDRYTVPESQSAPAPTTATFSGYEAEKREAKPDRSGVLPTFDHVRVEHGGTQRWLVVDEPPEKVWPLVKDFWQENGFLVKNEQPQLGIMETEWAESHASVPESGVRGLLSRIASQVYSTGEMDKYRTRLDRSADGKGTEIYITHYGMEEVATQRDSGPQGSEVKWQPRPSDPELAAEFLSRLMVRFGAQQDMAREAVKVAAQDPGIAQIKKGVSGELLEVNEPFDRVWRRVGLALDRVGFTVEDRDRQKGVYFVRYADPEVEKNKPGFFDRVFGTTRKVTAEQYRVQVTSAGAASQVNVLNKDGAADASKTAQRILALLHDQLK